MPRPRQEGRAWGRAWEAVLTNSKLSSHATRLHGYLNLLAWRNRGEPVAPTTKDLADALGLSGEIVRKARRELVTEGLLTERKVRGGKIELRLTDPDEWGVGKPGLLSRVRDPYPGKAERARASALARGGERARNLVFDALAEVCGYRETLLEPGSPIYDKDVAKEIGVAQARIRDKAQGLPDEALADEVRLRAALYQDRWPNIDLTPFALARRWNDVTRKKPQRASAADHLRRRAHGEA